MRMREGGEREKEGGRGKAHDNINIFVCALLSGEFLAVSHSQEKVYFYEVGKDVPS